MRRGFNVSEFASLLEGELVSYFGTGVLELRGVRVDAACHVPVSVSWYSAANPHHVLVEHAISRITHHTHETRTLINATRNISNAAVALEDFFTFSMSCTPLRNASTEEATSMSSDVEHMVFTRPNGSDVVNVVPVPAQKEGSLLTDSGLLPVLCLNKSGLTTELFQVGVVPVECGVAIVYTVEVLVYHPLSGDGVSALLRDSTSSPNGPLRTQYPLPGFKTVVHTSTPPSEEVTLPPPTVSSSPGGSQPNFTLWLGIAGIGGVLLLGALLIVRLTKRGRGARADSMNLVHDATYDIPVGTGIPQHAIRQHNAQSDRGSSIARYEAWRNAVGTHMSVGMEEVATPMPIYLPERMRVRASKGKNEDKEREAPAPLPLSPISPEARPIAPSFHYLDQPQSTRYASVIDSYDSNPLQPPEGEWDRDRDRERDVPAPQLRVEGDTTAATEHTLEEHSVAQLVSALRQHGIDLSNVPHASIVKSAMNLINAQASPLQYCCNCIRARNPYFLLCKCKKTCYCDEDCKRRHLWYHKADCK